jgi:hypothetical protein
MSHPYPWFRLYSDLLNDPYVQNLSDAQFRAYINTLCIASNNDPRGQLPDLESYAFALHRTVPQASKTLTCLLDRGLLEVKQGPTGDRVAIKNWSYQQFDSDTSYERVQRHRSKVKRYNPVSRNVTETAPETETDTDTNTEESSSLAASQNSFFQITDERWEIAQKAGFTNRVWVEQETSKFNLKGKGFATKYPDIENAWLMWLQRGKEYAEKHPNVIPMKPAEAPRRRHMFGEK